MRVKLLAPLLIAVSALSFTGCYHDGARAQIQKDETNMFGLYKCEEANYQATGPTTVAISSDDLYERNNFQGEKTTLLWGLVTFTDY